MTGAPLACVIGDMDLVRPLGLAGISVIAAGPTGTETRWSRYTKGSVTLPDLWSDPRGTVDALICCAQSQLERPVLFYQKDPAVVTISRYRAKLSPYFQFVVPAATLVEDLIDKSRFRVLAEQLGLPVPRTQIVKGGGCSREFSSWRYPLIVKPVVRNQSESVWFPLAGHAAKAYQINDVAELETLICRPELDSIAFVVQEMISGPESNIWSYHAFIDDDGITVGEFTGRKIRTRPAKFGQSTAVQITTDPDVLSMGRNVLRALDYTGVAKVDMKRDATGRLYVLEVNPRFSLWHHPGAVAGVNLPAMVYRYLTSGPVSASVAQSGVTWCQLWGDRQAALESGMKITEWLRFAASARSRRAAHLDDPGSIAGALSHGIRQQF